MITDYINKTLRTAKYKILENGTYFGEIPNIKGVWANARNLEDCRKELEEVLEDWLLLKVRDRERVPGFAIKIEKRELLQYA